MQPEDELGHDAEVAATAAERPEEVIVIGTGGATHLSVSGHDLDFFKIVHRPAEPARQVAEAAAERQPRHAGRGDEAKSAGQAVHLRSLIDIAQRAARADPRQARLDIHLDGAHTGHVEGDAAIGQCQARDVVSPALDGEYELVVADEGDGLHHVLRGDGPHHHGRLLLDHPVPDEDRLGETFIVGEDQCPFETGSQGIQRLARDVPRVSPQTGDLYLRHLILRSWKSQPAPLRAGKRALGWE